MAENFDLLDFNPSAGPEPTEPASEPAPDASASDEPAPVADEPEGESEGDYETALLTRLEEETGRRLQLERELPVADATEPEPTSQPNFLENLDIDEVLSSGDNLNKLLLAVYNAGIGEASRRASDNVLGSVNELVGRYVREQLTMSEMVREFYEQNEDLRPLRRTVAAYAKEISKENPDLKPHEVFAQTATKVRTDLKLKRITAPAANAAKRSFVPQRGRKINVEPELTGIEKEIMELVDI